MKKTLLLIVTVTGLTLAGSAVANNAEAKKQQDLQACETKTQQLPENVRAKQKESCECVVQNTDYTALEEAKSKGEMAKVQDIKNKARQACTQDM
ncbi:hypothetical protein [Kangiella shandongensis]|uniref:hypothetical protein n=1 Tax=Kangiella shandongensis TaxID=2763258 RepID=UPI001CBCDD47|nr:hypothetical protein [Kangiella shandongensis]